MVWCDDFDMDLTNCIPNIQQILDTVKGVRLVTHGGADKDGVLNHPSCWNTSAGLAAFFEFDRNDPEQMVKPQSYWTDDPVVKCSGDELLRDWWPHNYNIVVDGHEILRMNDTIFRDFQTVMFHNRGWHMNEKEAEKAVHRCRKVVDMASTAILSLWNEFVAQKAK
jgi:hypothetical protein